MSSEASVPPANSHMTNKPLPPSSKPLPPHALIQNRNNSSPSGPPPARPVATPLFNKAPPTMNRSAPPPPIQPVPAASGMCVSHDYHMTDYDVIMIGGTTGWGQPQQGAGPSPRGTKRTHQQMMQQVSVYRLHAKGEVAQ